MRIDGIPELLFKSRTFEWQGKDYSFEDVVSIYFSATVTQHSVNGIKTRKSYDANLAVTVGQQQVRITPKLGWLKSMSEDGMRSLQKANSIISQLTFMYRISRYEASFEKSGFFAFGDIQFHRNGHVFKAGKEIGSVRNELVLSLSPFALHIKKKDQKLGQRIFSALIWSQDVTVDLSLNRDCMLYMLKKAYGIAWDNEFIPEKRVDREKLFYETVIRFGALLAKADGDASSSELMQLKRFFGVTEEKLPNAARYFNEALISKASLESILGPFASEFSDTEEICESFLVGMFSVAFADGTLDTKELNLLRNAATRLGLSAGGWARILATVGLADEDEPKAGHSDKPKTGHQTSEYSAKLQILGLTAGASKEAIVRAYRDMVRRYHPDVLRGKGMPDYEIAKSEAILVQVNLAYEWLASRAA